MALPANVNTGWVTGTFMDSAGNAGAGTITFTPSPAKVLDATSTPPTTILPRAVVATVASGTFTQQLIATDDTDLNPQGWTYLVAFNLTFGGTAVPIPSFSIAVPTGLLAAAVDLTTVSPLVSSNGAIVFGSSGGTGLPAGGAAGTILTKNSSTDADASFIALDLGARTHAASSKTTPVDADELLLSDSAASFGLKKLTWANLKATIKTYLDGTGVAKLTTARNINGRAFNGTADITLTYTDVGSIGYCREVTGVYPGRPAGTGPVMFIGPDQPASGGTTAGGAGFVDQLDFWIIST